MLQPQTPAEGISKQQGFDDTDIYHIECSCTDPDHAVIAWIEIGTTEDWPEPLVTFYVTHSYAYWNGPWRRVCDAFNILLGRPLTTQHSLLLTKQSATNFAAALVKSIG
jgi:hypothetical protein